MRSYQITKAFSRAWQYRCATRRAARERRLLKQKTHRRSRHAFKLTGRVIKPASNWDVL